MADLITRSEYKAYSGINSNNFDSAIDSLIPKVSEFVKSYCRRTFVDYYNTPKSEIFNGGDILYLKEPPVQRILAVEYSPNYGLDYVDLIEGTDWVYDSVQDGIVPIKTSEFSRSLNGYKVTYFGGYTTAPEDLKLALFDLVTYYRKNDSAIHSQKTPGSNSIQIEYAGVTSLPGNIRRVLDVYMLDYT